MELLKCNLAASYDMLVERMQLQGATGFREVDGDMIW